MSNMKVKRQEMVAKLFTLCAEAVAEGKYDKIGEAFAECWRWNHKHEDEEIFMQDDDECVAVEDDVIYFNGAFGR